MIVPTPHEIQTASEPVIPPSLSGSPSASTLPMTDAERRRAAKRKRLPFGFVVREGR